MSGDTRFPDSLPAPLVALERLRTDMHAGFDRLGQKLEHLYGMALETRAILDRIEQMMIEERRRTRAWLDSLRD